jgi:hypothetical protein
VRHARGALITWLDPPGVSYGAALLPLPIEISPDFGALKAASRTAEQRLEIGEPNIIRPLIGADRHVVAALIIRAIDQQAANPHRAHFAERDFLGAFHQNKSLTRFAGFSRLTRGRRDGVKASGPSSDSFAGSPIRLPDGPARWAPVGAAPFWLLAFQIFQCLTFESST